MCTRSNHHRRNLPGLQHVTNDHAADYVDGFTYIVAFQEHT